MPRGTSPIEVNHTSGSTLIAVLVAASIVGVLAMAAMQLFGIEQHEASAASMRNSVLILRQNLLAMMGSQKAWQNMIAANASMHCLDPNEVAAGRSCPKGQPARAIRVYDSDNHLFYDSTRPSQGFSINGSPCTSYSSTGNDGCPIRVDVSWQPSCENATTPGSCVYPEEMISLKFHYTPKSQDRVFAFNPDNYNVTLARVYLASDTPIARCAAMKPPGFFMGSFPSSPTSLTLRNGTYPVYGNGCVSLQAFIGPVGPQGPQGPAGPQGPPGASAPSRKLASNPPPPMPPVCSAAPAVCVLYRNYLGRFPEQAGAVFWITDYQSLMSQGMTSDQALAQMAQGFINSDEYKLNHGIFVNPNQVAFDRQQEQQYADLTGTNTQSCTNGLDCASDAITNMYRTYLGRAPDPSGYQYWSGQLSSGAMSIQQIAAALQNSPEGQQYAASHSGG